MSYDHFIYCIVSLLSTFICIFKFYSNCLNPFPKTTAQFLRTLNTKLLIIFVKNSTNLLESEALPSEPCSRLQNRFFLPPPDWKYTAITLTSLNSGVINIKHCLSKCCFPSLLLYNLGVLCSTIGRNFDCIVFHTIADTIIVSEWETIHIFFHPKSIK